MVSRSWRCEREGTAYGAVRRFQELGLRFPRRAYGGAWNGKLLWGRLTHSRVLGILANPSYAGAYVFGRYQSSKQVGPFRRDRHPVAPDATERLASRDPRPP